MEIHISKVIDWVLEHSTLATDWEAQISNVVGLLDGAMESSTQASAKIPENIIPDSYVSCKELLQILEQNEGSNAKNMLGQYSVPHLQNWNSILNKWKEKNVYIADCQRTLFRHIYMKYPHLTRSITSTEKSLVDISRRVHENERNLHTFTKKVEDLLTEWEIDVPIKDSSLTAAEISNILLNRCQEIEEKDIEACLSAIRSHSIRQAMQYYFSFASSQGGSGNGDGRCLALQHLQAVPVACSPMSSDSGDDWTKISSRDVSDGSSPSPEPLAGINHKATHNQLVIDLLELSAFVQARLVDVSSGPVVPGENAEAILGISLILSPEELSSSLKEIQFAIALLENESTKKFSLLRESKEGSLVRVSNQIEQAMRKVQAVKALHQSSIQRQKELEKMLENMINEQQHLRHAIRGNKSELEKALTQIAGKSIVVVGENFPDDIEL